MADTVGLILHGESLVSFNSVYFTEVLKGMLLPPVLTESLSTSLRQDEVPTADASILSVFNMSLLLFIHDRMSLTHA